MKDPHKLDPGPMEKQFVPWLRSDPYHGAIMKDPHKLDPGPMEKIRVLAAFRRLKSLSRDNYEGSTQAGSWRHGEKQFVSWLHLGGSNPYHGTIMKDPHKLDPGPLERSKSCLGGI